MTHLHNLHGLVHFGQDKTLSRSVFFHYLCITTLSELILRDRTLQLTVDDTVHHLTLPRTTCGVIPHHLHLSLNPHDLPPSPRHTHVVNEYSTYRLVITATLPSTRSGTTRPRRHSMMRTTAHAPDTVTTFIFPANSIQHQHSIMTLANHLLLTAPCLTRTDHM